LPAEALTVDSSILTAISNDYGYDEIFACQIAGKMNKNDVFLGITTSGHSKNILRALEKCQELNIQTIVFTGYDGGLVKALANYCIIACGDSAIRFSMSRWIKARVSRSMMPSEYACAAAARRARNVSKLSPFSSGTRATLTASLFSGLARYSKTVAVTNSST
jgi:glucosamine 6-phosphate synthetase-like amidotransferase/phosphosugar isomerase protein